MQVKKNVTVTEPFVAVETESHAPRKLTFAENAILTVKVLAVLVLISVALFAITI